MKGFRFLHKEVIAMENLWKKSKGTPSRKAIRALVKTFSKYPERAGNIIRIKQVQNWFTNRRYTLKKQGVIVPRKICKESLMRKQTKSVPKTVTPSDEKDSIKMQFEAKSSRDSAWYDVKLFLAHRMVESGDPEVRVRFNGFGADDDEWVNVRTGVRQRSLPCEASECVSVLPGDLILCFKEGSEQALYFDAHILEVDRRRHDIRGCRCRFLVQYDHDESTDIVPLRKVCRRPETEYRAPANFSVGNGLITDTYAADALTPKSNSPGCTVNQSFGNCNMELNATVS